MSLGVHEVKRREDYSYFHRPEYEGDRRVIDMVEQSRNINHLQTLARENGADCIDIISASFTPTGSKY